MGMQLSSARRRLPTWSDRLPGGLFFDEAPHLIYLMQHFLGQLEVEGAWMTRAKDSGPTPERMEVRFQGARGRGYLTMWFDAPLSEWLLVLACTRSVLIVDLFRDLLGRLPPERAHNARDVLGASFVSTLQLWKGIGVSGARMLGRRLLYGHDLLIRRFLDAVVDEGPPPVTPEDGWRVVALMEEALRQSSQPVEA